MREQAVITAAVYDSSKGFLVGFNEKWRAYAFPMQKPRPTDVKPESAAVRALAEMVGQPLASARAKSLEHVGVFGYSERTGEETLYRYSVFEVDPGQSLPAGGLGSRLGFLSYPDLLTADLVTWSTKEVARALMEHQQVALAAIARRGTAGKEFLMVWNSGYGGYFFPVARVKSEAKPPVVAVEAVRADTGFFGPIEATLVQEVGDVHFSSRFNQKRCYVFHVCNAVLPRVDLSKPNNRLERALARRDQKWSWFGEDQLANPGPSQLSPTVDAVRLSVLEAAKNL
jgi:hypothetical protein